MDNINGSHSSELEKPSDSTREQSEQSRRVLTAFQAKFSGPLPPPVILQQYEDIFPGCADRIVGMAEKQAAHRQQLESSALSGDQRAELIGQISSVIVAVGALVLAGWLAYLGHTLSSVSVLLGTVATFAAVFIHGKNVQSEELSEKMQELDHPDQLEMFPGDVANNEQEC